MTSPVHQLTDPFDVLHRMLNAAFRAASETSPQAWHGAGIMNVLGGPRCFTIAYVALTYLRRVVETQVPIQVWHLGPGEMRRIMNGFDVELVDALENQRHFPMRRLGGWECKPYGIRHSPFRRVVLIDADNVPLVDPSALLSLPQHVESAAIF
ncbi:MAG TPA: hypothetical protein VD789_03220 [Thermomicrobiales bacterium]|nr:hypothetical protein [Thermomicrobiales bacterium]